MRLKRYITYLLVFIYFFKGGQVHAVELPCMYIRPQPLSKQTENLVVNMVDSPWCASLRSLCDECCTDFAIGLLQRFEEYAGRSSPSRMERFETQSNRILQRLSQDPATLPASDVLTVFQWMGDRPGDYFDRVVQTLGWRRHLELYTSARSTLSEATGLDDLNRRFLGLRTIGKDEPAFHTVREYYAQRVLDFVAPDGSQKRKLFGKLQSKTSGNLYSDTQENLDEYFDLYEEVAKQLGPRSRASESQTWLAFKGKVEGLREAFLADFRAQRLHGLPAPIVLEPLKSFVQKPERTPVARYMFMRDWPLGIGNRYDHNKLLTKLASLKKNDEALFDQVSDALSAAYKGATPLEPAVRERLLVGHVYNAVVAEDLARNFPRRRITAEPAVLHGQGDFLVKNMYESGRDVIVEAKLSLRVDQATEAGQRFKRQLQRAKDLMVAQGMRNIASDFVLATPDELTDVAAWLPAHINQLNGEIADAARAQGKNPQSFGHIIWPPLKVR